MSFHRIFFHVFLSDMLLVMQSAFQFNLPKLEFSFRYKYWERFVCERILSTSSFHSFSSVPLIIHSISILVLDRRVVRVVYIFLNKFLEIIPKIKTFVISYQKYNFNQPSSFPHSNSKVYSFIKSHNIQNHKPQTKRKTSGIFIPIPYNMIK